MNTLFNPLAPSIDLFRKLSTSTLSGSSEIITSQLDHVQELVSRSSKQWRETLSTAATIKRPENWSEAFGQGMRNALEISREYAQKTSALQREAYDLLQQQAIDAQKTISASLADQFAVFKTSAPHSKPSPKASAPAQRAAA